MTAENSPSQKSNEQIAPRTAAPAAPTDAPPAAVRTIDPLPRQQRYRDFAEFGRIAPQFFKDLCAADEEAQEFERHYSFYAVSNGRWGGDDKRAFEVFFGNRPFDVKREGFSGRHLRTLTESGASLSYAQDDRGRVHCTLRPASSDGMSPVENAIELKMVKEPRALLEKRLMTSHFRSLIAYMHCTSLDGDPGLAARTRIGWLRLVRRLAVSDRWHPPRIWVGLRDMGKYVATIGLSGFLFFAFQEWRSRGDTAPKAVLIGGESAAIQAERGQTLEAIARLGTATLELSRSVQHIADRLGKPKAPPAKGE